MRQPRAIFPALFSLVLVLCSSGPGSALPTLAGSGNQCPRSDEIAPCQCRERGPAIQVRCTSSMMGHITEAMTRLQKRVSAVDVLILEDNNIPHLPSRAFASVQVNRLFLQNNKLTSVDRNAFAGIEDHLTEIYIKEPGLRILPVDSVDFLRKLTVFSMEQSLVTEMPRISGLRKLQLFKVDGSLIRQLPTDAMKDLPSLRYLHFTDSKIQRLDVGLLENLHYLQLANLTGNDISWIHPRAFRYMEQLSEVSLSGNELRDAAMVGRTMRVVKSLKRLDLSHNLFEQLNQGSFMDIINLESLDLSHNKLTELTRGAFHRMPRLKKVNLSHNLIRSFHSNSFMDTREVEELLLSYNALSHVTDVSFIMDSLPKLKLLDLSHNVIRDIPFGALRGYPALERLLLADNQIGSISKEAFADMPSLKELDLSSNKLFADALDASIFNLPQLKMLKLSFNKLSQLTGKLLSSLTQLEKLDVSNNGIMHLDEDALLELRHLKTLNISFNSLKEIKSRSFTALSRLEELDASHNQLVALPDNLLYNQRVLKKLSFAHNQIQLVSGHLISEENGIEYLDFTANFLLDFPEFLVTKMKKLRKLRFQRNSIQKLGRHSFQGLAQLESVDMHDNRIELIEEDAFKDLANLKSLDLSLNIISTVGDNLEPLVNLMKLNLSDNYITSLPRNAFHSLTRLSTLDVSNNTIVEIGRAFVRMPELKYLDLSYNHLPMLQEGSFQDLPSLIALHLHHNSIQTVAPGAFQDLGSLESILLNKNGISELARDTFRDLSSLQVLRLDDNLIEDIDSRVFVDLYALKELHLEHNLIEQFNERAFVRIPSLRFLNMSFNLLRDLPRGGFRELQTLETIDLSFNDLREIDETAFEALRWLAILKLNDNNICRLHNRIFRDALSLRKVSVSNNRLTQITEEALGDVKSQLAEVTVAGNPINCDCHTLWLRNWISESESFTDEPRCASPKSLSDNPLRTLRTSRFTCDSSRVRSSSYVQDGCNGIPLKVPAQEAVLESIPPTTTPNLHAYASQQPSFYPSASGTPASSATTDPSLQGETPYPVSAVSTSTENEVATDPLNDDHVVISTANSTAPEEEYYEYYYVYYDEEGNMVNGSGAAVDSATAASQLTTQTKLQEITIESAEPAKVPPPLSSLISDDKKPGDTPTIYAQITESEEHSKPEEEDSGLSIFGIPIPKLPIDFGFGKLGPALSSGLLPLPIGRKDGENEASDKADAGEEIKAPEKSKPKPTKVKDQTRGPDILDPIWIETGLKAASINLRTAKPKVKTAVKKTSASSSPVYPQSRPSEHKPSSIYSYQHPHNPLIPLRTPEAGQTGYFPADGAQQQPGQYFPKGYLPALKFDHPMPLQHPAPLVNGAPVLPPPGEYEENVQRKRQTAQYSPQQPGVGFQHQLGSPQHSVNGFIPLFRPNKQVPLGSPSAQVEEPPVKLPPGFKIPSYVAPAAASPQLEYAVQKPQLQFDSNDVRKAPGPAIAVIGEVFPAVPEQDFSRERPLRFPEGHLEQEEAELEVAASSTEQVAREPHRIPQLDDDYDTLYRDDVLTEREIEDTTEYAATEVGEPLYEYVYEDELLADPSLTGYALPKDEAAAQEEIQKLLEELRRQGVISDPEAEESSSTERAVPTLAIHEVTTKREEILKDAVEIAHKGTPKTAVPSSTAFDTTTEQVTEASSTEQVPVDATTERNLTETTEAPEYIYEYYYEYYEDTDGEPAEPKANAIRSSTAAGDAGDLSTLPEASTQDSLKNFLNMLKIQPSESAILPAAPVIQRPTTAPPVRTSTQLYNLNGNYLESHRSSVTVDSVGSASRFVSTPDVSSSTARAEKSTSAQGATRTLSSSPYPFHPDRLDPGAQSMDVDEKVRWYYDAEKKDPFVADEQTERNEGISVAAAAPRGSGAKRATLLLGAAIAVLARKFL